MKVREPRGRGLATAALGGLVRSKPKRSVTPPGRSPSPDYNKPAHSRSCSTARSLSHTRSLSSDSYRPNTTQVRGRGKIKARKLTSADREREAYESKEEPPSSSSSSSSASEDGAIDGPSYRRRGLRPNNAALGNIIKGQIRTNDRLDNEQLDRAQELLDGINDKRAENREGFKQRVRIMTNFLTGSNQGSRKPCDQATFDRPRKQTYTMKQGSMYSSWD